MQVVHTIREMQQQADAARAEGKRLGLVPTMGALHDGHLSLVRRAMEQTDHVTVSIFVNPTQFGPNEDFDAYPREYAADQERLESLGGVDVLFLPTVAEMYPNGQANHVTWVTVEKLDAHLCGRYREGHFRGVTTVVSKLFHACKPHRAFFGLKDAQQFLILKRMVQDLNMDITLEGVPTYRNPDGLAASSRNLYLTPEQRHQAPIIYQALQQARARIESGEHDADAIRRGLREQIGTTDGEVQYAEVVDTDFLQPVDELKAGAEVLVAVAVFYGKTRLIDNVFMTVGG